MKQRTQRIIGFAAIGCAGALLIAEAFDLHLNVTDSMPVGIWTRKPLGNIERGTLVTFCLPRSATENISLTPGDCPDTYTAPLLKPIAAIEGDTVQIKEGHPARVNGKEIPNTIARPSMQSWPTGEYTVKPGEVWVLSSYNHKSYDSRYFGPVSVSTIQGEAVPLLVLESPASATGEPL